MFDVTHKTRRPRLRGAAALTLVAGLALTAACAGDDGGGDTASETRTGDNGEVYNEADLQFANQMIPHHAQAVQMANLTMDRPVDPPVRRLADDIRAAQTPEVQQMVEWLTGWGEEIPETRSTTPTPGTAARTWTEVAWEAWRSSRTCPG